MDVIFPKKKKKEADATPIKPLSVEGYKDDENLWDYITQIGLVKAPLSSVYKSKNFKSKEEAKHLEVLPNVPDNNGEVIYDACTPPIKDDDVTAIG